VSATATANPVEPRASLRRPRNTSAATGAASAPPERPAASPPLPSPLLKPANHAICAPAAVRTLPVLPATASPGTAARCAVPNSTASLSRRQSPAPAERDLPVGLRQLHGSDQHALLAERLQLARLACGRGLCPADFESLQPPRQFSRFKTFRDVRREPVARIRQRRPQIDRPVHGRMRAIEPPPVDLEPPVQGKASPDLVSWRAATSKTPAASASTPAGPVTRILRRKYRRVRTSSRITRAGEPEPPPAEAQSRPGAT